jgi:hypothetical protein
MSPENILRNYRIINPLTTASAATVFTTVENKYSKKYCRPAEKARAKKIVISAQILYIH